MKNNNYFNEFDKKFEKSSNIKFFPYVGRKYKDSDSKIMILGESHYLDPNLRHDEIESTRLKSNGEIYSTRYVFIDEYFPGIRDNGSHPLSHIKSYRYTAAMITGKGYQKSDYVWQNLSFYNFFQEFIGKDAKDKSFITSELIENSRKALWDVIDILSPKLIIVWGLGHLYSTWLPQDDFETINGNRYLYKYTNRFSPFIWHIRHPSSGFSYQNYNKEFIKIAEELNMNIGKL